MDIVSRRYSSALFDVSKEEGKIEIVLEQLNLLEKLLNENQSICKILEHPNVSSIEKQQMIDEIFSDILDSSIMSLLKLLVEKERIDYIKGIIENYKDFYMNYCNMVKAYVTSANELDDGQKRKLSLKLTKLLNKTVAIEYTIDDSLLGGLLIRVEDQIIDTTIKGKLESLKAELLYDAI